MSFSNFNTTLIIFVPILSFNYYHVHNFQNIIVIYINDSEKYTDSKEN